MTLCSERERVDSLDSLTARLLIFSDERDWHRFHDATNLVMLLASEVGELMSEYRWVTSEHADTYARELANRGRVEEEIGDVGIALLLLCARTGIDLKAAIATKIEINARNYPVAEARGKAERP
jgi:NTP pyrophosphatase (non-canonical NTP hydrolase)